MADTKSIRFDISLKRTEPANQKIETNYIGALVAMRPNFFRLRLANAADPRDFEEFVHDGLSLYAYSGLQKSVTEHKSGSWLYSALSQNMMLDLLHGMTAKELKSRFEVRMFKEDENYLDFELKPSREKDKLDFQQIRVALHQARHVKLAYLPAQVALIRPSGETETWKLSDHMANSPEINERLFRFEQLPGFRFQKAP
jgi:TIGR03009 family protein